MMKKLNILIIITLLAIFLCSCTSKNNQTDSLNQNDLSNSTDLSNKNNNQNLETGDKENKSSQESSSEYQINHSDNIIAWGSFLLGSYNKEENLWKSCSPVDEVSSAPSIKMGDVLTKSSYYVYYENEFIGESTKIRFPESDKYRLEDMENSKALIALSESNEEEHMFNLPVSLNNTIYNMIYPSESLLISYDIDYKYKESPDFMRNQLIMSCKSNLYPREYSLIDRIPKKTIETVDNLFSEHKVTDIIPNYKYCYLGDFDADNDLEYLTVINNKLGENNEIIVSSNNKTQQTAFYNIIIYQDGTNIQILKNVWNTTPEIEPTIKGNDKYYSNYYWSEPNYSILNNLLIADINDDSLYEFLFESYESLFNNLEAYSIVNDNYQLVLKSIYFN